MKSCSRHFGAGFTLIEILLVVLLLSIVVLVSVPNFSRTYTQLRLTDAANQMQYLMRYAQQRAITKGTQHRIGFNEDFTEYFLTEKKSEEESQAEGKEEDSFQHIAGRWGRPVSVPQDIAVSSPVPYLEFFPDGTMSKADIQMCQKSKCLIISTRQLRGQVSVFPAELTSESAD